MNTTQPIWHVCPHCGEQWTRVHYCPKLDKNGYPKVQPLKQLTEEDVRRIVREELEKRK